MEHMFTCQKRAHVSALSSYGSCEARNKCSCILATKLVTQTNYYDRATKCSHWLMLSAALLIMIL